MTLIEERAGAAPEAGAPHPSPGAAVAAGVAAFLAVVVALWVSWPVGVALGLVVGTVATAVAGRAMHRAAQREDLAEGLDLDDDDDLPVEARRLRMRLGEDWPAFCRAAVLVTRSQQASLAGLQRELRLPVAAAQHVMVLLEREGFVGPSRGGSRRQVLLPRDRADDLEALLAS